MPAQQFMRIVISFVFVLGVIDHSRLNFEGCPLMSVGLLAAEPSAERKSDDKDAIESRKFRAAMAAHHICSGLWVVGRS